MQLSSHHGHGNDARIGYRYANWETGYGDFHCVPDMGTLRHAAWLDRTAIVICDIHENGDMGPRP